ncbi:SDR family oxidoreductase [Hydrogenophaga sp. BPS33]|uniref:SDR family oxidoreductase n=1 Tax=Hydrogenophaga sp. BPS33 TaxID=2651974 RepID=UPI0013204B14|nr:SDR family oxidoreductase [Hydrogenophaga sp. BPS33]QHE87421.1 SDR family oxidoreductase [Hydrogenophaga sp. BPS33]
MNNDALSKLFNLEGQVALVTGGSRGLGLQIAIALGEAGAKIMLTSRKAVDLEDAAGELRSRGIEAQTVAADASEDGAAQKVVDATMKHFKRIDILVNNAGATWGAPAEDHPLDAWDKVMNLNARSLFTFSQAAARASMIPNRRGRIINVASVAGLGGNPTEMTTIAYNTSKAAAINFTRALAAEWGKYGINVNALAPGFFPTKMTVGLLAAWGEENVTKAAPLGRLGNDEDLKGATLLFATAAGRHITGQVLAVDGGVSCVVGG